MSQQTDIHFNKTVQFYRQLRLPLAVLLVFNLIVLSRVPWNSGAQVVASTLNESNETSRVQNEGVEEKQGALDESSLAQQSEAKESIDPISTSRSTTELGASIGHSLSETTAGKQGTSAKETPSRVAADTLVKTDHQSKTDNSNTGPQGIDLTSETAGSETAGSETGAELPAAITAESGSNQNATEANVTQPTLTEDDRRAIQNGLKQFAQLSEQWLRPTPNVEDGQVESVDSGANANGSSISQTPVKEESTTQGDGLPLVAPKHENDSTAQSDGDAEAKVENLPPIGPAEEIFRVTFSNPQANGGKVAFRVQGTNYTLGIGQTLTLSLTPTATIQYHRGGRFGFDQLPVDARHYEFAVSAHGWRIRVK